MAKPNENKNNNNRNSYNKPRNDIQKKYRIINIHNHNHGPNNQNNKKKKTTNKSTQISKADKHFYFQREEIFTKSKPVQTETQTLIETENFDQFGSFIKITEYYKSDEIVQPVKLFCEDSFSFEIENIEKETFKLLQLNLGLTDVNEDEFIDCLTDFGSFYYVAWTKILRSMNVNLPESGHIWDLEEITNFRDNFFTVGWVIGVTIKFHTRHGTFRVLISNLFFLLLLTNTLERKTVLQMLRSKWEIKISYFVRKYGTSVYRI